MSEHERVESRRDFLRQAGTIAWATPFIVTMAAGPARAQAVSCAPAGSGCGSNVGGTCVPTSPLVMCCGDCLPSGPNFCFCQDI